MVTVQTDLTATKVHSHERPHPAYDLLVAHALSALVRNANVFGVAAVRLADAAVKAMEGKP